MSMQRLALSYLKDLAQYREASSLDEVESWLWRWQGVAYE